MRYKQDLFLNRFQSSEVIQLIRDCQKAHYHQGVTSLTFLHI
jgi:hypothetical protein